MKTLTFSIVSAVTVAYSLGCFLYFNQPFWGFTAICVGALVTVYPLYFEKQRIQLLNEVQLAEYISDNLPSSRSSLVIKSKLASIKADLDSIRAGIVPLTYSELAAAAEMRMAEKLSGDKETRYFAIHIVDSVKSLGVWGKNYSEYPYLASYVAVQKRILNSGGTVLRLFLFDPNWLKQNVSLCRDAVSRHEHLYEGTETPIQTLCGLLRRDIEVLREDFSILDEQEVFYWERSSDLDTSAFMGGQYIVSPSKVRSYVTRWRHLSDNAYRPEELFRLLEENRI